MTTPCPVIGTGPEGTRLEELAEQLAIRDLVRFRRNLDRPEDLYSAIKASRVFVLASEREGFGIAVLEAIACGIPVVTTNAPDNAAQNLVRESGFGTICDPTVESVAAAIAGVLDTGPTQCFQPPVSWLANYSWPAVAHEFAQVLQCT